MYKSTQCSELNVEPRVCAHRNVCSPEGFSLGLNGDGRQLLFVRTTGQAYHPKHGCEHQDKSEPFTIHALLLIVLQAITSNFPSAFE
jgi:hypothetical protein